MSITLKSRRGAIGKNWHAVALREAMEIILGVGRAGGGKADARAGKVQWLDVSAGTARGDVLGADGHLYQARIDLPVLSPSDQEAMLAVARPRPELPARLAAGQYPQEIEGELARSEVSLLPRGASELSHDCSCLDWPGPCRHVAALSYVLVEAVDERPIHLLTLRGLTLDDLVGPPAGRAAGTSAGGPSRGEAPEPGSTDPAAAGSAAAEASATAPAGAEPASGAAASPGAPSPEPDSHPAASHPADSEGAADAARPASFDPSRMDPELLAEVIGAETAAAVSSFYRAGAADATADSGAHQAPHPPGRPDDTPPVQGDALQ